MKRPKKLSDNSLLLSFDDFKEKLESKNEKLSEVIVPDIILSLLFAQFKKPIFGRTMLMKQIFLLYEEILKEFYTVQDPKFVPYNFGPYSFLVMQLIENMRFSGSIVVEGRKNTRTESFALTKKGIKMASKSFSKLASSDQKIIREKRMGWDQLGIRGMLKYVYINYPEYKEKSKVKERYSDINWGIGKA